MVRLHWSRDLSQVRLNLHRQRLIIDCTLTLVSGRKSGVERVVRQICQHAPSANKTDFAEVIPAIASSRGFQAATPEQLSNQNAWRPSLSRRIDRDITAALPKFWAGGSQWLCRKTKLKFLQKWLLPKPGRGGVYRFPLAVAQFLDPNNYRSGLDIKAGDTLLLPDAYWSFPQVWKLAAKAKKRGARIVVVIYDAIPLTHRELYSPPAAKSFEKYLKAALLHADLLMCISQTVANQIAEIAPALLATDAALPQIRAFRLGAEVNNYSEDEFVRQQITKRCTQVDAKPHFLMVGTIEIRKNHSFVLQAMEQVWQRFPNAKLTIAGRVGWRGEEFLKLAAPHPKFGDQLCLLHDCTDTEINALYRGSNALVFASVSEGFGLPIVESLYHRKPTLVSDIAIHREVGGDMCKFFSLADNQSLVDLMLEIADGKIRVVDWSKADKLVLPWQDSIADLVSKIEV